MVSPVDPAASQASVTTYTAPINSCIAFSLFVAIAKAAGKSLTTSTFTKAGYGLHNVTLPGDGAPVSFAQGQAYPLGPVYVGHFDPSTGQIALAAKPVS